MKFCKQPLFYMNLSPSISHSIGFASYLLLFGYNFLMNGPI